MSRPDYRPAGYQPKLGGTRNLIARSPIHNATVYAIHSLMIPSRVLDAGGLAPVPLRRLHLGKSRTAVERMDSRILPRSRKEGRVETTGKWLRSRPSAACGPGHGRGRIATPGTAGRSGQERVRAWSRSGTLLADAARSGDFVTFSAAAAASFSVIFAITASRARLKDSRLVATNSRDWRSLAT